VAPALGMTDATALMNCVLPRLSKFWRVRRLSKFPTASLHPRITTPGRNMLPD
jgi:hypothetical protein